MGSLLGYYQNQRKIAVEEKNLERTSQLAKLTAATTAISLDKYGIERPALAEETNTRLMKARAEQAALEQQEKFLNSKTDVAEHPAFRAASPEQQEYFTKLLNNMGALEEGSTTSSVRNVLTAVQMIEADKKLFTEFSDMGISARKAALNRTYEELSKAQESGNQKKSAEIQMKVDQQRKILDGMINAIDLHKERLDEASKMTPEMKDFLVTKYGSINNWDPKTLSADRTEFVKFVQERNKRTEPRETGTLSEAAVLENLDKLAWDKGDPEMKDRLYRRYQQHRRQGLTREEAYLKTIDDQGGEPSPKPTSTNSAPPKEGGYSSLWR